MKVVHLKRPGTELSGCGETGPFMVMSFKRELVTCAKCMRRNKSKMHVPAEQPKTVGRIVQPGGGHRR